MINSIRSVRRARGLTLDAVAARCDPPTTAQTIGRLETGTRTLSIDWLNRIAAALDVDAAELVRIPTDSQTMVTALIGPDGADAPQHPEPVQTLRAGDDVIAARMTASLGDYRGGDEIWCRPLDSDAWHSALNRDVLVPRPAGRFVFGRLLGVDSDRLHILPLRSGARQIVVTNPAWLAVAVRLVRTL